MNKVRFRDITINLDNRRKPLNSIDREKISKQKLYPYCGANAIMDYVDEYIFDEEILCIAEDGGKWGKNEDCSYIMKEKCWVNNHAHVIKVTDKVDIRYLRYWLNYNDLNSKITGAIVRKLTQKVLNELEIIIPEKNEQLYICNILDKVQEIIDIRKKQIEGLDNVIKSQFVEMFGDPIENPKNYKIVKLSDIADYWNGLTYKPTDVNKKGTIVLRSSNIQNFQLDYQDIVRVNCNIKEKQYVEDNDILMCSRNGSARLVGKVAVIKDIKEKMTFGAFMMIIRSEYYSYLFSYFQTDAFRNQIKSGATTTINQITGNMLNKIKLHKYFSY